MPLFDAMVGSIEIGEADLSAISDSLFDDIFCCIGLLLFIEMDARAFKWLVGIGANN